jgi:hypothetical protein
MDRKSVSGIATFHRGNLVSWASKKQTSVSLSTAESEYIAAALSVREIVYIRKVLKLKLLIINTQSKYNKND